MFRKRFLSIIIVTSLFLGALSFSPALAQETEEANPTGMTVIYNLYATDNYVTLADGTPAYIFGFVGGRQGQPIYYQDRFGALHGPVTVPDPTGGPVTPAELEFQGNAQYPAPIIYARRGDVVEIRLKNLGGSVAAAPNDPHSIHLHGLDVNAANDGVPETSVGAVPANICADGTSNNDCSANGGPAPGAGNVIVYMFSPTRAGTYMYHCHQEASIHVQMGMYGALVVYNPADAAADTGPGQGMGGKLYGWTYDKDYVLLESEFDLRQHASEEMGGGFFNPVEYQPQYWFLNGLSFPNTIHAGFNWNDWILAHPGYDPLITGSVSGADKVLLRMINMGFETQPMHMHGFHGKVIGSDQRPWTWSNNPDTTAWGKGLEKNTLTIGSGETYEWLLDFGQQSLNGLYPAGTETRYAPANNLPQSNTATGFPAIPDPFVPGAAYVGGPVVGPDGNQGPGGLPPELPVIAGQYFPFHNHDDYKATNNGEYPGGMFTMIITEP
jgi:hypothetical protein